VLEILLAQAPSAFGAGELAHVVRDALRHDRECACGEPASRCEFWREVRDRLGWSDRTIAELAELFPRVEWHKAFPKLATGLLPPTRWRQWVRANTELLGALGEVSGASVIVDSSKYPGRALALSRAFPDRTKVVCLTRSPAGLYRSFQKPNPDEQPPKTAAQTLAYYLGVALTLRIASTLVRGDVLFLRYEDLAADPEATLARIGEWADLDLSGVLEGVARGASFPVGHIMTGNRLRKQGPMVFRPEVTSATPGGPAHRATVLLMRGAQRLLRL
jgi:hypothetical protein